MTSLASTSDVRTGNQRNGINARVRTSDDWAVPRAILTVTDSTGQQVARAVADTHGLIDTDPLPSGMYTVVVTAPGFGPTARSAFVAGNGHAALGVITLKRDVAVGDLPTAGVWTIDPAHSAITFSARHLGLASVRGRFGEFTGVIEVADPVEMSTVTATIQTASVDTGNETRDAHLRSEEFLNIARFPVIEYQGKGIQPLGDSEKGLLSGQLTLNSITRPVDLLVTYLGVGPDPWGGVRAAFHAVAELKRQDFAITYNQMLQTGMAAIGTTLRVEIDIEAVQGGA